MFHKYIYISFWRRTFFHKMDVIGKDCLSYFGIFWFIFLVRLCLTGLQLIKTVFSQQFEAVIRLYSIVTVCSCRLGNFWYLSFLTTISVFASVFRAVAN
jgi:hypothetical protein